MASGKDEVIKHAKFGVDHLIGGHCGAVKNGTFPFNAT
jgi:hypothetical protein